MERIKLTASARNQLAALKRKTGVEHNNVLCRHALCMSLANPSSPPEEDYNFNGGLEIDWRTLTGGNDALYENLLVTRLYMEGRKINVDSIRDCFTQHVHRGLSYMASRRDEDLLVALSTGIQDVPC